jgi:pyrroloquinoline-quinone synthase
MEHFPSPYQSEDLTSPALGENLAFLAQVEARARTHRVFRHPFLQRIREGRCTREQLVTTLTLYEHIMRPFTGCLAMLAGRAPDLQTRFVLFDNLYEEMGRGRIDQAHPRLYRKMLASLGVDEEVIERSQPLASIRLSNDAMVDAATRKPFPVACAWFGAGTESYIPPTFGSLVQGLSAVFEPGEINLEFLDRHGVRDDGHAADANLAMALHLRPEEREVIPHEVDACLTLRANYWDQMASICGLNTH